MQQSLVGGAGIHFQSDAKGPGAQVAANDNQGHRLLRKKSLRLNHFFPATQKKVARSFSQAKRISGASEQAVAQPFLTLSLRGG